MSDKCIVSVSSLGRENYNEAMLRLIRSCVECGWDGDYLLRSVDGYCDEYLGVKITLGSWPITEKYKVSWQHADMPYQFKPFAIQEAKERGYRKIIWCDSSIRMVKDPQPLLDHAAKYGICAFHNLGFPLKEWLTDNAQERLGISDAELENADQIMACCVLWDFNNPVAERIFDEWIEASKDFTIFGNGFVSRRSGFKETRHDQSFLSGLLWKYKIPLLPYGKLVYPPHDKSGEYGNDIYFINRGIK